MVSSMTDRERSHTATLDILPVVPPDPPSVGAVDKCREIQDAQLELRDALGDFLARPSMEAFESLRGAGLRYLDFERRVIVPFADSQPATDFQIDELRDNHDRLVRAFNVVLWDSPANYRLLEDARKLRNVFLQQVQQVQLCERAVCPYIDLR